MSSPSLTISLSVSLVFSRVDPIPYDTPKPAGHTRFVCVSDTHSRTDGIQMPYGDVLLHMGDFTELGLPSEVKKFNDWLGTKLLKTRTPPDTCAVFTLTQSQHAQALVSRARDVLHAKPVTGPHSDSPALPC